MIIKIRNWPRWQSYRKDRGQPPWIKLWRCLLRNPDWLLLTDSQRGQLSCLWMLAGDNGGKISMSASEIVRVCGMSDKLDLKVFKDRGFIDFGVSVTSRRRQRDASESESEAETDEPTLQDKIARQASLGARDIAETIITEVNAKFGTKRSAVATLVRAVEILLRAGIDRGDILLVVRHRLKNEDWFDPNKYGAESLIRRDKFPSMLQIARENQPRQITASSVDEGGWEY